MPTLHKRSSRDLVFAAAPTLAATEALFEGVHDAVFCVKDRDRRYVAVNRAFVGRARVPDRRAVLGRTAGELFPPLLAAGYEQQDDLIFATGRAIRDKVEMVTNADGTTGWYLAQKVPDRPTPAGRVVALAGVSADLRSPVDGDPRLAALAGAIDRIQRDYAEPPPRRATSPAPPRLSLGQLERRLRGRPPRLPPPTADPDPRRRRRPGRSARRRHPLRRRSPSSCGFYDQAQFCRQFRHATGLTPSQYRAALHDESDHG